MEVMGCPPLSVPTLDPRSYRMEPRQGKKRRKQSELSRLRGRWEQRFMTPAVHGGPEVFEQVALAEDFIDFLTLPAYRLVD